MASFACNGGKSLVMLVAALLALSACAARGQTSRARPTRSRLPQPNTLYHIQVVRGLSTNRSLLSCTDDGKVVDLYNFDDGSGRQKWQFIPGRNFYNIKVAGGMSTDRRLLSTNSDGSKVDLYHMDDASGRQRWTLTPLSNGLFHITIQGGVSNAKKYLSTVARGYKVDLYFTDDDSGRQQWLITPA